MSVLTEEAIQQEIDDISAFCADMNEEEEVSWLGQLDLDVTPNLSGNNQSLDVSSSIFDEIDENTKDNWLFPVKGFEKRDYQLNISKSVLFNNTLVILPTGLGKTFIASVVIYNFMRWFPQSKIVFMAPTRPLVQQQLSACYDVVGIPKTETAEMTGKTTSKKKRKQEWDTKRIFFATPQVVQSDIKEGIFPSSAIKLLIFDEAHKAKGEYAYCKVIQEIYRVNTKFRVCGLTATAGKTADIVQIIQNLLISKIEHRSEGSIDVHRYTHKKAIEIVPVKLSPEIQEINDHFIKLVDPIIKELRKAGMIQTNQISKGYLIVQRKKLVDNRSFPNNQKSTLLTHFSAAIGFFHSLEILQRHSVHLFLKSLKDEDNKTSYKFFIARDFKLTKYVKELDQKYEVVSPFQININPLPNGKIPNFPDTAIDFGHPKFDILKTKLKEYFDNNGTKAIIFCEYRDTTHLIYTLLLQLTPQVLPSILIGQGGKISQKDQLQIMKNFREGKTNTLVCTCVAEEGLDIGDVDLVICFDINSKNAVRFVQRIGRTARKRNGQVIVLATEGKELSISRDLIYAKDQMNKSLSRNMNNEISKYFYRGSRLFPKDFNPKCIEMKFIIANEDEAEQEETVKKTKGRKSVRNQAKKNLEPKNSKEAITNYLKPVAKKSRKSVTKKIDFMELEEIEEVPIIQVDQSEEIVASEPENFVKPTDTGIDRDLNYNELLDEFKADINGIIESEGVKEGTYAKFYIDQHVEKEVDYLMNLNAFLNAPVDEKYGKLELEPGEIDLTMVEPKKSDPKIVDRNELLQHKKAKFMPVTPKFNESADVLKSPEKSPEQKISDFTFYSPLPIKFSDLRNSSTPIISKHFSPRLLSNFSSELNKISPKPLQSNSPLIRNLSFQTGKGQQASINDNFTAITRPPLDLNKSSNSRIQNVSKNRQFCDNQPIEKKFEFLGIMSIEDIFEGCDSHVDLNNVSKCTESVLKSDIDSVSMINESATENILKKFNIENLSDIFESSNEEHQSLKDIEKNILLKDENHSNESDMTQVYDVDEEIARIEESKAEKSGYNPQFEDEVIESSQKENILQPSTSNDDLFLKKTDSKPNLSKLMSQMQSNGILAARNIMQDNFSRSPISQIQTQRLDTQIGFETPPKQEITIRSNESTPDIGNKSSFYGTQMSSPTTSRPIVDHLETIKLNFKSPAVRRRNMRRKRMPHSSFLQTQAGVDGNYASSDEQDEHDTSLNEFVCNDTVEHDETMMHAKYLKSLQSPSAARNGRFVLRQLQPANISDIYSQMPHDDEDMEHSDDSMGSFIVDGEEESVISEVDELELAEKMLKEKRRKRKLKQNFGEQKKKRKIVVAHSDSSDEDYELEKLRNEVLANPDS